MKKLANAAASMLNKLHTNVTFQEAFESLLKLARSPLVKSLVGDDFDIDEIERAMNYVRSNALIHQILNTISDLLECLSVDRFEPVQSVDQLHHRAYELNQERLFMAALNFENVSGNQISYRIHMDTDNTQPTFENKNRFWFPGPAASMLVDLKYHRGFVQLKQMVDLGIIKHKRQELGPVEEPEKENDVNRPIIKVQSSDDDLFDDDDDDFDFNLDSGVEEADSQTTTLSSLTAEEETTARQQEEEETTTEQLETTIKPDLPILSDGDVLSERKERVRREDLLETLNFAEPGIDGGSRVKRAGLLDLLSSFGGDSADSKTIKFDVDDMQFYTKQFPYPAYTSDE